VTQALTALLSLAIASRHLDGEPFALWAIGGAVFAYVSLLDAGASMIVQRSVASRQPELAHDAATLSKTLFLVAGGAGLIAFIAGQSIAVAIVAMVGAAMTRVAVNVIGATLIAEGGIGFERTARIVSSITLLSAQYLLLDHGVGISAWATSMVMAAGSYLGLILILSGRARRIVVKVSPNLKIFRKYRSDHINWLFYTIPALFIYNFQVLALALWSTNEAVATFSAGHQLYYSAISVFSITSILSAVSISRFHYELSPQRNRVILQNLHVNTLLVSLSLGVLSILLEPIGKVLFPALSFEQYWMAFAVYGLFLIVESGQMAVTNALIHAGETNFKLVNVCSALINVVACYYLVPVFGLVGAILSVTFAQTVTCNYFNIRKGVRHFSLPYSRVIFSIGLAVASYCGLVLLHWLARRMNPDVGPFVDVVIVVFVAVISLVYLLPRVLSLVEEYHESKLR
jgi:O-antigen/teichoic acid export membrane protein